MWRWLIGDPFTIGRQTAAKRNQVLVQIANRIATAADIDAVANALRRRQDQLQQEVKNKVSLLENEINDLLISTVLDAYE
jgi:hypothetical protein